VKGANLKLNDVYMLIHATTLGTNLLLGQEGLIPPKLALITTKGFRDVVEIGRQRRTKLYNCFLKNQSQYEVEEITTILTTCEPF